MKLLILNGPNLNLLGKREPAIYGSQTMETYVDELRKDFNLTIEYKQSNIEGELINFIQQADENYDGIVLNAGGYTHTSVAIGDAVAAVSIPVIEVHISNVYARESYRHESRIAANCAGVIAGFGMKSYRLAIQALLSGN